MSWRGGRGGGRGGRGSGRGAPLAVARDDDGLALIPDKREGPPPLFPKVEVLPDVPELTGQDEKLLSLRRQLALTWRFSPYHIEKPRKKAVGVAAEIERYSDRYKPPVNATRPPLSSVLKLELAHFPSELLGAGGKVRQSGKSAAPSQAPWRLQTGLATNDLQRLDQLASLESKIEKQEQEKGGKEEGDEKKKQDGDDEEVVEEEEEEEEFGDDDYAQAYGFDDDDDYLDVDEGGDEGPVF